MLEPRTTSRPRAELRSSSWGSLRGGLFGLDPEIDGGLEVGGELASSELERMVGRARRVGRQVEPALVGRGEVDARANLAARGREGGVVGGVDAGEIHRRLGA